MRNEIFSWSQIMVPQLFRFCKTAVLKWGNILMRAIIAWIVLCGICQVSVAGEVQPIEPEIVHFPSGKVNLGGELFKPKGPGPFPAVLYNHGSAEGMLSDTASKAMGPLYVA